MEVRIVVERDPIYWNRVEKEYIPIGTSTEIMIHMVANLNFNKTNPHVNSLVASLVMF